MKERTSADITIYRTGELSSVTVPITSTSKRVVKLMESDYIQLDFVLETATFFPVGSYVDDDIFGRFYVTEEQMPKYDTATGGYKYELKMNAWYYLWGLKQNMLIYIKDNKKIRKEAEWSLTDNLTNHALEILHNLQSCNFIPTLDGTELITDDTLKATYLDIETEDISKAAEALTVTYNGTSIIEALKSIADTYECEYWVTGSESAPVIHFGKCEQGTEQDLSLDSNIESVDINNDTSSTADKLYVFGSTDNVPYTYRKKIYAKVVYAGKDNATYCFQVPNISFGYKGFFDPNMMNDATASSLHQLAEKMVATYKGKTDGSYYYISKSIAIDIPLAVYNINYHFTPSISDTLDDTDLSISPYQCGIVLSDHVIGISDVATGFDLQYKEGSIDPEERELIIDINPKTPISKPVQETYTKKKYVAFAIKITAEHDEGENEQAWLKKHSGSASVNIDFNRNGQWLYMPVTYNETTYLGIANKYDKEKPDTPSADAAYYRVTFDSNTFPAQEGETVIIDDTGRINIPLVYYTQDYEDPSSLLQVGENRLRLPYNENPDDSNFYDDAENPTLVCLNNAILPYDKRDKENDKSLRESTVIFDKIYPDGKLQVTKVYETSEKWMNKDETSTEAYEWDYTQYHLNLGLADSNAGDFTFDKDYILDGQTLGIRFLVPEDIADIASKRETIDTTNGCKLCGMQFEVEFNDSIKKKLSGETSLTTLTQLYSIVRNDDFGAKLPSSILHPTVGDPCVLLNWNVRAISYLGLVDNAEQRLMQKAFEYYKSLKEGSFTFTCNMMSDFMFDLIKGIAILDADGKLVVDADDKVILAKNDYSFYAIPVLGQKVKINHKALKGGSKTTRIIGMELKLDKPYDTPKFTCGETDAYSRIKQLEKEITKLSK